MNTSASFLSMKQTNIGKTKVKITYPELHKNLKSVHNTIYQLTKEVQ